MGKRQREQRKKRKATLKTVLGGAKDQRRRVGLAIARQSKESR